ncbi:MAG: STAS domain-containing protein [Ruminococcus sp.]|nr:STAS domain-containing protein [Ruminococcus sp.]
MTVNKISEADKLLVKIQGRVDTTTAPVLEKEIKSSLEGVSDLTLDFAETEYISSAGLRVLLSTQKIMNRQGAMKLVNVSNDIMEIFEVTGFTDVLTIE